MKYVIRVVQATGDGEYVMRYDPDAGPPDSIITGDLEVTSDVAKALKFDSAKEAMEFYRKPSTRVPYRADGRANSPLTAYTVSIEPLRDNAVP